MQELIFSHRLQPHPADTQVATWAAPAAPPILGSKREPMHENFIIVLQHDICGSVSGVAWEVWACEACRPGRGSSRFALFLNFMSTSPDCVATKVAAFPYPVPSSWSPTYAVAFSNLNV